MVVNNLEDRKANLLNLSYGFLHVGGELKVIFWFDDVSKINYKNFGDVIAFDATYSNNKCNMIFILYTGGDHHFRCVTFGAGLFANKTAESYKWLLESFLKVYFH